MKKKLDSLKPLSYLDNITYKDNYYVYYLVNNIKKNKSIKNVGIIGPYGSGKSSVTHSSINVLDKRNRHTLFFSKETLSSHINKENIKDNKDGIKIAIYKELLSIGNFSSFHEYIKDLNANNKKLILKNILLIFLSLLFGGLLFTIMFFTLNINPWISGFASGVLSITLSIIFLNLKFTEAEFNFSTEFIKTRILAMKDDKAKQSLEDDIKENPVFYETIICKLFKEHKIRYLVLEDIERIFEYNKIDTEGLLLVIEQFKILNELVNRSKIVSDRVVFIYGLNDRCFKDAEQKTKFFDLIVPITPVSTYSSASKAITDYIDVEYYKIDREMINALSFYFKDQRKINALLTHFFLTIGENKNTINASKLFALSALSVLFPYQYGLLADRHNYLDNVLNGKYIFKDKKLVGKDNSEDENLKGIDNEEFYLFLKTCVENNYITKDYKTYLSIMKISDNVVLTDNDSDVLKAANAHEDVRNVPIDYPNIIIERDEYHSLLKTINQLNPSLIDAGLLKNKEIYAKNLEFALSKNPSSTNEKLIETILSLFENCNNESLDVIVKIVSNTAAGYLALEKIADLTTKANVLTLFIRHYEVDYYLNNAESMEPMFSIINSEDYSNNDLYVIDNEVVNRITSCKEIALYSVKRFTGYYEIIKEKKCYTPTFQNVADLYPDFSNKPFTILLNDKNLKEHLINTKSLITIMGNVKYTEAERDSLFMFLSTLSGDIQETLLDSNAFNDCEYKIKYNESNPTVYANINKLLLKKHKLDINNAFNFIAEDVLNYISNNTQNLIDNHVMLDNKIAIKIITTKPLEDNYAKLMQNVQIPEASFIYIVTPLNKILYGILDTNTKEKYVQYIIKNKPDHFIKCLEEQFIEIDILSACTLSDDAISAIFNKDIRIYYPLLVTSTNKNGITKLLAKSPNNPAKLLFDNEGNLLENANIECVVEICSYEYPSNPGCAIKVLENINYSSMHINDWHRFISKMVNEETVITDHVYSIPKNNDNDTIMKLLETIGVITIHINKKYKKQIRFTLK